MAGRSLSDLSASSVSPASSAESVSEWDDVLISDRRINDAIEHVVFGDRAFTWIDLLVVANNKKQEVQFQQLLTRLDEFVKNVQAEQMELRRIEKRVMERKKKGEKVEEEERLLSEIEKNCQQMCNMQLQLLKLIENMVDEELDIVEKIKKIRIRLMSLVDGGEEMDGKKAGKKQSQKNM